MSLFEKYLKAKEQFDLAKDELENLQSELYLKYEKNLNDIPETATLNAEEGGFSVKIIKKETVKVDQGLASVVDIGFRKKYELDKTKYKKLPLEDQKRVDECLTTSPAKPSFTVERIM